MAISEKIKLLGAGCYADIPDELTLKALPTTVELEFVGSEDFDGAMVENILPQAIEEKIDCKKLLEIDYQWICRCLRILNYGPIHTTNTIFCDDCGKTSYGEFQVNLQSIGCKPLPENFKNEIKITKDKFVDFDGDIVFHLPTIQDILNSRKDSAFKTKSGRQNTTLARFCYMIKSIKGKTGMNPVEIKAYLDKYFTPADYIILKDEMAKAGDFGLRAGGIAQCPKCGSKSAAFMALVDERFFRPTVGDLREWRNLRSAGADKDVSGDTAKTV